MQLNIPYKVRAGIYITTGVLSLVVGYMKIKGYIGDPELTLWAGVSAFANGLAAFNVTKNN